MSPRSSRQDPEWRAFEQLVARIERDAAGADVVVTAPDRLRCRLTGRLREVDASLRTSDGRLTTIECRRRRGRQDVTWIEQLATKKASLGAARTIAVSASGFSDAAHQVAEAHDIALKDLREIETADLDPRLNLDLVLFWHKRVALAAIELRFARASPWVTPEPGVCDMRLPDATDVDAPIFRNVEEGHRWSVADLWAQMQAAADPFAAIKRGAPPVLRSACFPYPNTVDVDTSAGVKRLGDVVLTVMLWIESEPVWRDGAAKLAYGARHQPPLQRVEFASARAPEPWRIGLQLPGATDDGRSVVVSSQWPARP